MSENNDFFSRVYEVVKLIPAGRVTTYGAVAAAIGSPGAARMVGWAMNKAFSHTGYLPAHRVVNRNGMLTGKHAFPNANTMQELLESEGVRVKNDKVMDFQKVFWAPEVIDLSHHENP
ncbi:MAG: methylated-DNA-protein-cysteine methyltransferase related protein [Anaerophaga sp.]|nr:methylated-DNA-protein-cysteine methyltransferase related protein [Anaerophaga sp.]MDK2840525.1 methylated-DNA-protein-cysteine methyltransferase related protein [Anaerophaga sp.]